MLGSTLENIRTITVITLIIIGIILDLKKTSVWPSKYLLHETEFVMFIAILDVSGIYSRHMNSINTKYNII